MKSCRDTEEIPRKTDTSSEFPRNPPTALQRLSNGYKKSSEFSKSPSVFSDGHCFLGNPSEFTEEIILPRYFLGNFRGNTEETTFLGFLGISSVFPQKIPRNSFSLGMSLRIVMFSCSANIDAKKFYEMLDAANQPLYSGCREGLSKLSLAARMMNI